MAIVAITPQASARWGVDVNENSAAMGSEAAAKAVAGDVQSHVLSLLQDAGRSAGVDEREIPVAAVVEWREWTEEGGQLTLTGKVDLNHTHTEPA